MSRRAIIMAMMKGVSQGGHVLTEHILHAGDGGNSPLYSLMNGLYVMMGLTHTRKAFTAADLGKFTAELPVTMGNGILNFFSRYNGTVYNVLAYLPNCTKLDCHNVTSLTQTAYDCTGMTECTEIRFDGTAEKTVNVKNLTHLQSIRYSVNTEEITLDGNTNLGINIL